MKTRFFAVALSVLVALLAACVGSSPSDPTLNGAASPDDFGSGNTDPTGSEMTTSSGGAGAHSTGLNGDAGTATAWEGFRLPVQFPTFPLPPLVVLDVDAGGE